MSDFQHTGRMVADPELKVVGSNNTSLVEFTLAYPKSFVRKDDDQKSEFMDCVAWRETAEYIAKLGKKGAVVEVIGSLKSESFKDKEGKNRKRWLVSVERVNFWADFKKKESDEGSKEKEPAQETVPEYFQDGLY